MRLRRFLRGCFARGRRRREGDGRREREGRRLFFGFRQKNPQQYTQQLWGVLTNVSQWFMSSFCKKWCVFSSSSEGSSVETFARARARLCERAGPWEGLIAFLLLRGVCVVSGRTGAMVLSRSRVVFLPCRSTELLQYVVCRCWCRKGRGFSCFRLKPDGPFLGQERPPLLVARSLSGARNRCGGGCLPTYA